MTFGEVRIDLAPGRGQDVVGLDRDAVAGRDRTLLDRAERELLLDAILRAMSSVQARSQTHVVDDLDAALLELRGERSAELGWEGTADERRTGADDRDVLLARELVGHLAGVCTSQPRSRSDDAHSTPYGPEPMTRMSLALAISCCDLTSCSRTASIVGSSTVAG